MNPRSFLLAFTLLLPARAFAAPATTEPTPSAPPLKPLMVIPDKPILEDDFSKPGLPNKSQWQPRQGTRWLIEDGVLRGRPSTAEFQAAHKDHSGKEPRIAAPSMPQDFLARFSVRFIGGSETPVCPFIEFNHHVCRLRLSEKITELLAAHDTLRVAEANSAEFHYHPNIWYHVLAERHADEIVIQIATTPTTPATPTAATTLTLYAKHESIAGKAASGAAGLGIAGPRDGAVEIDNVSIFSVNAAAQGEWEAKRKSLPTYKPVPLNKKGQPDQ